MTKLRLLLATLLAMPWLVAAAPPAHAQYGPCIRVVILVDRNPPGQTGVYPALLPSCSQPCGLNFPSVYISPGTNPMYFGVVIYCLGQT